MSISSTPIVVDGDELHKRIETLKESLLANDPQMPTLLAQIHQNLIKYPDLVHLLKEEEIGLIVKGLERHTQITILAEVKTSAKKLKNVDADMMG